MVTNVVIPTVGMKPPAQCCDVGQITFQARYSVGVPGDEHIRGAAVLSTREN